MNDGGTPIDQLRPELQSKGMPSIGQSSDNNLMSYQDVLKDLNKSEPESTDIHTILEKRAMPPQQQVHSQLTSDPSAIPIPPNVMMPLQQQQPPSQSSLPQGPNQITNQKKDSYDFLSDNIQQDIGLILVGYVLLHSDFSQKLLKEKFPNMFSDNFTHSTFGLVSHAILLVVILYAGKICKDKFLK